MMTGRAVVCAALLTPRARRTPARSSVTVPLEIPEPPPRVAMDPVPAVIAETPAPPEQPAATPVSRPARPAPPSDRGCRQLRRRQRSRRRSLPRRSPRARRPPPELRAAGTAGRTPTAAQVRDRLVRAKQKLDSIDRPRLNAGKRTDYDSARRFLSQAEAAVKENNLLLAESSVEKAETLADGLQ